MSCNLYIIIHTVLLLNITQIEELISQSLYEDAITLCMLCDGTDYTVGVDISKLHESCGDKYLHQFEYEKAVDHYIKAALDFIAVMRHFIWLIPTMLHGMVSIAVR